jgi:nitrous oxidase accessory protein
MRHLLICGLLLTLAGRLPAQSALDSSAALVAAVRAAPDGATFELAPGTFVLEAPLELKSGQTLKGASREQTILLPSANWMPATTSLPDPEIKLQGLDTSAYLIRLKDKAEKITITDLTLRAPQLHGAIFSSGNAELHLQRLRIQNTLWTGVRTFGLSKSKIHECDFMDAGGRWKKGGVPGKDGGITAGAIFSTYMSDTEIYDNRFIRTRLAKEHEFYGIKGRHAKRCRIHHNTIDVNFSIEFPFENDEEVEIDHNKCSGTISIPKHAGGPVPKSGKTFHIHHNWLRDSYSIEFVRNGVEVDHNLFDFDVQSDHGNAISGFGKASAAGPAKFHNNLVNNPGRGVIWINEVYNNLEIRNNHILTRTTSTPRKEGLFGFNSGCDFKTISICNNVIECQGQARPLVRNAASLAIRVENNTLTNVSDADKFANRRTDQPIGLEEPLKFTCGALNAFTVEGWQAGPTKK